MKKAETPPQSGVEPVFTPRWTLRRFVDWIQKNHNIRCCRETVRKALLELDFSWKKFRKILNKANPKKRAEYVEKITKCFENATAGKENLVFIDEAHPHLDCDEGYGWTVKGKRAWVSSDSPGLKKVSFYGLYFYNQARVQMEPFLAANGDNTIEVLKKIRAAFSKEENVTVIWDNVSYHHSAKVVDAAKELNINLLYLPSYSPDFMPVEHLWQWTREDVTYQACYKDEVALIEQVRKFAAFINTTPLEIADRLWVKKSIDSDEEKLRFSA